MSLKVQLILKTTNPIGIIVLRIIQQSGMTIKMNNASG
jgi:hypothetical protein